MRLLIFLLIAFSGFARAELCTIVAKDFTYTVNQDGRKVTVFSKPDGARELLHQLKLGGCAPLNLLPNCFVMANQNKYSVFQGPNHVGTFNQLQEARQLRQELVRNQICSNRVTPGTCKVGVGNGQVMLSQGGRESTFNNWQEAIKVRDSLISENSCVHLPTFMMPSCRLHASDSGFSILLDRKFVSRFKTASDAVSFRQYLIQNQVCGE